MSLMARDKYLNICTASAVWVFLTTVLEDMNVDEVMKGTLGNMVCWSGLLTAEKRALDRRKDWFLGKDSGNYDGDEIEYFSPVHQMAVCHFIHTVLNDDNLRSIYIDSKSTFRGLVILLEAELDFYCKNMEVAEANTAS